uniref:Fructose-1,6-bisphosphatase, cytosolic n=1 Tax=Arundo donax TaxID=35708 RepID=A0A0A9FKG1_ARUDO
MGGGWDALSCGATGTGGRARVTTGGAASRGVGSQNWRLGFATYSTASNASEVARCLIRRSHEGGWGRGLK